MPCNSDHLAPTVREKESKRICEHLMYLKKDYCIIVPDWASVGAKDTYGINSVALDEQTAILCAICKKVESHAPEAIYDGRNPKARKLADWWDAHKEADVNKQVPYYIEYTTTKDAIVYAENHLEAIERLCRADKGDGKIKRCYVVEDPSKYNVPLRVGKV